MIKKTFLIVFIIVVSVFSSGYKRPNVYVIDATKNAALHNDLGLKASFNGNYYEAIQEFCLAIALNPGTQATAVYYNNLGETYMKLGYYKEAQKCFEYSVTQYSLSLSYYQNLVKSLKAQNKISAKIKEYQAKSMKNSLSMIILGLLYVEGGNKRAGIIKLDEFCMREPDLVITPAVMDYVKQLVQE